MKRTEEIIWGCHVDRGATQAGLLDELIAREQEISKASTSFPNYQKLMLKWENHVLASHGLPTFA
jgi:hypothetical protein